MIRTVRPRLKLQCLLRVYTDVKFIRTSLLQRIGVSPKAPEVASEKAVDKAPCTMAKRKRDRTSGSLTDHRGGFETRCTDAGIDLPADKLHKILAVKSQTISSKCCKGSTRRT